MNKKEYFMKILNKLEKKYGNNIKRLASDGWGADWKVLIVTIMSAQSRDEMTIIIANNLFKKYSSLSKLANARKESVLKIFKSLNYNRTKAKHVVEAAKYIKKKFNGRVPENIEDLVEIPGVGRKTANLVLTEVHGKDAICVDTHVHRISNVLGLVKTKSPEKTEIELMKIVPKKYWYKVNRLFVLWGKDVSGRDKKKLLKRLNC